ncbi:MAG: hypothetical protein H0X31_03710 [Nostocaceae cyanobacterium]|nr:hypothetical protein [Nostocaceae cyanobacterium]
MLIILAEYYCGRWGCSWQEAIFTLFFTSLFPAVPGLAFLVIGLIILLPIVLIAFALLSIYNIFYWIIGKQNDNDPEKSQQQVKRIALGIKRVQAFRNWHKNKQANENQDNSEQQITRVSRLKKGIQATINLNQNLKK